MRTVVGPINELVFKSSAGIGFALQSLVAVSATVMDVRPSLIST